MRASKSKLTHEDILEAEIAKDARERGRKAGFSKMHERDQGYARMQSLDRRDVIIQWPTKRDPAPGEALRRIPEGYFALIIDGKEVILDADEFGKNFRWV